MRNTTLQYITRSCNKGHDSPVNSAKMSDSQKGVTTLYSNEFGNPEVAAILNDSDRLFGIFLDSIQNHFSRQLILNGVTKAHLTGELFLSSARNVFRCCENEQ